MRNFVNTARFLRGKSPGQLIIQLTDKCNAKCPQCSMRVTSDFSRNTISETRCLEIIDQAAKQNITALSITGGEPLLYPELTAKIINYCGSLGIKYTRTGTNGYFFRDPESADFLDKVKRIIDLLSSSSLRNFWISIDSADPDTHDSMRGFNGLIKGIEKALPLFHDAGLYPTANLGLNRNLGGTDLAYLTNGGKLVTEEQKTCFQEDVQSGLERFFQLVENIGFTLVNFCYPMSIDENNSDLDAVYPASSIDKVVRFSNVEKSLIFKALLSVIPTYRPRLRIFSPLCNIYTLQKVYSGEQVTPFPCRGGLDYHFINAGDGMTYPCGYRGGENLGDYREGISSSSKKNCSLCDWECFRDPSELMGPLNHIVHNPLSLFTKYRRDSTFYKLWLNDLRYYKSCDLFSGRTTIDRVKLKKLFS